MGIAARASSAVDSMRVRNPLSERYNLYLRRRNTHDFGAAETRLGNGPKVALRPHFDPCEGERREDAESAAQAAMGLQRWECI
jgi:hypothetical protein